jgi:predicted lipid-binding transport protein (Tim44 family)
MALIIAARFTTFEQAQGAARALFAQGFAEDDVHIFYVNTAGAHAQYPIGGDRKSDPDAGGAHYGALLGGAGLGLIGAVAGGLIGGAMNLAPLGLVAVAGVGAYIGSLIGALWVTGRRQPGVNTRGPSAHPEHPEVRQAGVLLALHTDPTREAQACKILRDAGGEDVERAQGSWQQGRWVDFDPLKAPDREPDPV